MGSNPYAVAISQRLGNAYVVNDGSISVVSLTSHKELDEFGTGGFHGQNAIALVRNDSQGYVTNVDSKDLVVFDTGTDQVTGTITVGTGASDVVRAASPAGQAAYAATPVTTGINIRLAWPRAREARASPCRGLDVNRA